jgi:eukaryotic-like serine/threonine-protein kinase
VTTPLQRLSTALADRYAIERELGAGGMATVYLAHDARHDRKVALKVLRPELSAILGGERFLAEIKTTANLQHPHILSLFDSGEADGLVYYVMPYVEGESLRDRLTREKQLPVEEAVRIAREVADALEYAHQHGIVHRDIKPENILLHGGHAMVADFGIALAASRSDGGTRMTETGMSLGTPHYMAPEQAMGEREITPKADIYALGCVLYEMLTAEPPFVGATAQAIIARVMTEEPRSLTLQRKSIPPHVEAAVERALEKLPADRFATAAEFADALGRSDYARPAKGTDRAATAPRSRRALVLVVVPWVLLVAAAAYGAWRATRVPPAPVGRYAIVLDSAVQLIYGGVGTPPRLSVTPDGGTVVYVGVAVGSRQLLARSLSSLVPRAIPGTSNAFRPAVSRDGSQVAFLASAGGSGVRLQVASLEGGPAQALTSVGQLSTPAWGPEGYVYYIDSGAVVLRIPGGGGTAERVVSLPPIGPGSTYTELVILPAGRGALVSEFGPARPDDARLLAVDLRTGRVGAALQGGWGRFVPELKALIYGASDGTLMAVPFDERSLATRGRPVPVFGGIAARYGAIDLDFGGGTLVYARPGTNATERMVWVDRATGMETPVDTAWRDVEYEAYALSPDGRRLAITIAETGSSSREDIWIKQLDHGPLSRLTFGGSLNETPSWTADGRYVSYVSTRDGHRSLWRRRADGVGVEERVTNLDQDALDACWSRDGAWLLVTVNGGSTNLDILAMHAGTDSVPRSLLAEPHAELKPRLSPDGRWLAYVSNETGALQVFVRPFPDVQQGKWQISTEGGTDPTWSANGRELFFRSPDGQVVSVAEMSRGPASAAPTTALRASATSHLEINTVDQMFSAQGDGHRFLFSATARGDVSGDMVIVQNFVTELRAALAAGAHR